VLLVTVPVLSDGASVCPNCCAFLFLGLRSLSQLLAHGLHITLPHLRAQGEKNELDVVVSALNWRVAELEACIQQVNEELDASRALAERGVEAAGQREAASKQAISQLNTKLEQERAEVCTRFCPLGSMVIIGSA
jgi:phage tail protein X